MEYRILVNNKFAAIETEEEEMDVDPLEHLKKLQDQLAEKKLAVKKAPVIGTKTEKPKVPKTPAVQSTNKAASAKPQKAAKPSNENKPASDSNIEQRPERNGFRGGRGGGVRRGGGFRGARGGAEGGRREFDRHSGSDKRSVSGVKPHDKREGGGAHNWGSVRDDINEHLNNAGAANPPENSPQKFVPEEAAPAMSAEEIAEKEALAAEREAEERQMTLQEWKKMQEEKRLKASFNIRKPNEGSSETAKWKKMFVLKKKNDDEEDDEEEEEEEEEEHEERKTKNVVPINITFTDSRNQGNNRRGGPRGAMRGGRGGVRGGRFGGDGFKPQNKVAVVPNVDDEKDFPSLS